MFKAYLGREEKDAVIRHYLDQNQYDLFIDDNSALTLLNWSSSRIQGGERIVMTAILTQWLVGPAREYECPRCKAKIIMGRPDLNSPWITW